MNMQGEEGWRPLGYSDTTPPAAPVQIGTIGHIGNGKATLTASILSTLYTAPPAAQRQVPQERKWVGLTDEEIELIFRESSGYGGDDFQSFARAIEAKLKEKNT
jgi:hypothetical protein